MLITDEIKRIVEEQIQSDDETTASQLYVLLVQQGHHLDLRTVLHCRTSLGCQLICNVNKQKRLEFAKVHRSENFTNVIFTDECSVQHEAHRRHCCCKIGEPANNKPSKIFLWLDDVIAILG